jgi:hypothetical protein
VVTTLAPMWMSEIRVEGACFRSTREAEFTRVSSRMCARMCVRRSTTTTATKTLTKPRQKKTSVIYKKKNVSCNCTLTSRRERWLIYAYVYSPAQHDKMRSTAFTVARCIEEWRDGRRRKAKYIYIYI